MSDVRVLFSYEASGNIRRMDFGVWPGREPARAFEIYDGDSNWRFACEQRSGGVLQGLQIRKGLKQLEDRTYLKEDKLFVCKETGTRYRRIFTVIERWGSGSLYVVLGESVSKRRRRRRRKAKASAPASATPQVVAS